MFNEWVEQLGLKKACFWAHATFDFPILMHAYRNTAIKPVLQYRSLRDLRTLELVAGDRIKWDEREGVHHNASDDALYQAIHAGKMLKYLQNELATKEAQS